MPGKGIQLKVTFWRVKESDKAGCLDIECRGNEEWIYAHIGSHAGMQGETDGHDPRVMEFGGKMAALVREYFGNVPPVMD